MGKISFLIVLLLVASLGLASCGGSNNTVEIDGSSTVFPISEAAAYEFRKVNPKVQVNVGVSGTGGGFKRFIAGETDVNDASRPIKEKEASKAIEAGVEYIELNVAIDGLSVVVNPKNDFVSCLTIQELKNIWEPGSNILFWNEVREEFPDKKIALFGPDSDSGTFDYFTEVVVGETQASRSDYNPSPNDNVLVNGIQMEESSLGYFGYAYYIENANSVKSVAVDSGNGCIQPTEATIASGDYSPLSRPLHLYVNKASLERAPVRSFLKFYLENGSNLAKSAGYIPLSEEGYQNELQKLSSDLQ